MNFISTKTLITNSSFSYYIHKCCGVYYSALIEVEQSVAPEGPLQAENVSGMIVTT